MSNWRAAPGLTSGSMNSSVIRFDLRAYWRSRAFVPRVELSSCRLGEKTRIFAALAGSAGAHPRAELLQARDDEEHAQDGGDDQERQHLFGKGAGGVVHHHGRREQDGGGQPQEGAEAVERRAVGERVAGVERRAPPRGGGGRGR